jgi:signal transduction histidine kinase/DNA-binding NarL/FixJ family response regulator
MWISTNLVVLRPLGHLTAVAQRQLEGDLAARVELLPADEFGQLGHIFNVLTKTVEARTAELQGEIAERKQAEAALQRAKEEADEARIAAEKARIAAEEARIAAETANRAKSQFLANMSHELRTPLNAILGFAQIMRRDTTIPAPQQENIAIINRSGEHLLDLINDVLEISKIEAGQNILTPTSFDLHHTLDDIEEMMRIRAEKKDLHLIFERAPNVPGYIKTDERKLRQVLINLLHNGIKFTEEGGVTLRVRSQESENSALSLLFEVEDTGVGIAPEEIDSLFEPFTQTESGQQIQTGTGLGLPISRQFVQLMGGNISVTSQMGQGTIFKWDIQVEPAEAAAIEARQPTRRVMGLASDQPGYRILIAEDNFESRTLLRKLLEGVGFEVQEAANGQQAVEMHECWQPHLVWMDMRMPVMDGYEATKQIKASLQGQATTIIALTASAFEENRAMVLSSGCDDFVRKPFRETELFDKMAEHLGVRYLYEYLAQPPEQDRDLPAPKTLTPADLASLPADWVTSLHDAARRGQAKLIFELLEQIQPEHTLLAEVLKQWVDEFRFDKIVSLIEQKSRTVPKERRRE